MTTPAQPTAYLVESIPQGLEDLRGTEGISYTEDVLAALTDKASHTIDLTAMYWALLPDPKSADEEGFTVDELDAMGATTGRSLYDALDRAAGRGVRIRILESPGFGKSSEATESATLQKKHPDMVTIHQIQMGDWYGGSGIMHQKVWVFDGADAYVGSANMDWKSIMQVKEMGIAFEHCPDVAADLTAYLDGWFYFSGLKPATLPVVDPDVGIARTVPNWSSLATDADRAPSPLADPQFATRYNWDAQLRQQLNGQSGDLFISGCPTEVCGEGRTFDGAGLVNTINDATRSVCVSVMDLAPAGLYSRTPLASPVAGAPNVPADSPVWWSDLFDALLTAALTRRLHVRLLISKWAHTSGLVEPFLQAIAQAGTAGRSDRYLSAGQLEVKQFMIPGWDQTTGSYRKYPGHTRVNHTKYIVTDRRVNIGTSNMTWDYFSSTAGCSVNADHASIVDQLQSVFDRDWSSRYAYPLV